MLPEEAPATQREWPRESATRALIDCDEANSSAKPLDRPVPPAEVCEELHAAVARAAARSADSMAALELAVRRFTVALQNEGATPEAVLISLKTVINSRTFHVAPTSMGDLSGDELRQLISTWSIREFFSATA